MEAKKEILDFRSAGLGERYIFTTTGEETSGELVVLEAFLSPNTPWSGPPHIHREQEEQYEIISGSLDVLLSGKKKVLRAGERIVVPAGVAHTFGNFSDEEVHFISEHRPALRFQEFLEELYKPIKTGEIKSVNSLRGLLAYSVVAQKYRREILFANPALRLFQRVLAFLGHIIGFGR